MESVAGGRKAASEFFNRLLVGWEGGLHLDGEMDCGGGHAMHLKTERRRH
jgi:cobalamin synthase